jgi:flavin-binding protein dodecin
LADGRYIFKVTAKDSFSNPLPLILSGERISEPVDIDNAAPTVSAVGNAQITNNRARVSFEAIDAASRLQKAEYSVNGGEWQEVYADDGISDGAKERYTLEIPLTNPGEYTITLRVSDANGNIGNARALAKK